MDELFRLSMGVRGDPGVDAWFDGRPDELGHLARFWFNEMRGTGDDVLELLHDGYPVACVQDAPFGYVNVFIKDDLSTNCWWVGLVAWGEGWHNNHHAFPKSARHGLRPWEMDGTWMLISLLKALGLAKNVQVAQMRLPRRAPKSNAVPPSSEREIIQRGDIEDN